MVPNPSTLAKAPGVCEDLNRACAKWAAEGQCEKNKGYMVRG